MAIPKHDDIRIPALELLSDGLPRKSKEFELPLAQHFGLSEEEILREYESGNGKIFYDRVSWTLSYLNMSGLVTKPKRGVYLISDTGRDILKKPDSIHEYIKRKLKDREPSKKHSDTSQETDSDELTPQEELYSSASKIRNAVYDEILEVILSKSPREFEKLVVLLLQKMGYGGEIQSSGVVTQQSNDKGIDGIIREDVLGLGRINVQAKRYSLDNSVGREEIQRFVGALAVAQSNKGVFITTSSYSKGAIEYSENLNATTILVLIDGRKLAEYIYDYGLGMQVEQTIELKKLDSDFWDSMADDPSI